MKRIGILGGTFNPVHIGHLTLAQMVHEQLKLDKVIFVPSYLPPHKSGNKVVSPQDRYHMLGLAIKGIMPSIIDAICRRSFRGQSTEEQELASMTTQEAEHGEA